MREKILHIMWRMDIGGAERAVYQLIQGQRCREIEADLLIGSHRGYYGEKTKETGARVTELFQKHALDLSISSQVLDLFDEYSIVNFHSNEIGLMKLASRKTHLKRFYTHRGGVRNYAVKKFILYKITGHYLRKYFHGIAGNTLQAVRAASKLFGIPLHKIMTIYNGIDFSLLEPRRMKQEVLSELHDDREKIIRIGTSANLRDWKRTDLLLEAIHHLRENNIHCYVIGDGPSKDYLEKKAQDLGIAHLTTFTGKKSHVGDYLQILDIFVLPSGPEESFGNSAVEAMGFGLPTIVFADGGGLVEHIENQKTGFIVTDVDDLTTKLHFLLQDQSLRQSIGLQAQTQIRNKYSIEKVVTNYSSFYHER